MFRVWGPGLIQDLGFSVQSWGFKVYGLGLRDWRQRMLPK